jgi:peptidoglycan biosynthesis protein MviN/MurJ (putative lipid II flippase)
MLLSGLVLIPSLGLAGVGIAYVAASSPAAIGTIYIARRFFVESARTPFMRAVITPVVVGAAAFALTALLRQWTGPLNWIGLLLSGAAAAVVTAAFLLVAEQIAGGSDSRTSLLLSQVGKRTGLARLAPSAGSVR